MQVGDFLRVGSVGVVVIETHDGVKHRALSEEKIQRIMKDTASGGFIDLGETDGENSEASIDTQSKAETVNSNDQPICYMCFDEIDDEDNPLITPCKCLGDTRYIHVECLRKWHTAEADNQTKHEMAQRLFNTRFQLSFNALPKSDNKNGTRALLIRRSSGSDMVLDYRTVSARRASIRFKNGEFIFSDAGSSNGSYLYLRRPVELTSSQSIQFRLGRSMISMKVINKWNRRLLRAVRRTHSTASSPTVVTDLDDHSIGSDEEIHIIDRETGNMTKPVRRTRERIMQNLPAPRRLSQASPQHLNLLYALAYPKRMADGAARKKVGAKRGVSSKGEEGERKEDEEEIEVELGGDKSPTMQAFRATAANSLDGGSTTPRSATGQGETAPDGSWERWANSPQNASTDIP